MKISLKDEFPSRSSAGCGNGIVLMSGTAVVGNKVNPTVIETPVVIGNDSVINGSVGAFSYFSGRGTRLHGVKSVGRFCMINQ